MQLPALASIQLHMWGGGHIHMGGGHIHIIGLLLEYLQSASRDPSLEATNINPAKEVHCLNLTSPAWLCLWFKLPGGIRLPTEADIFGR